jgi:prevent-host-death family protein
MIRVKMHAAKTNLSRLVAQAEAGEEIVLMRGNAPVARIVPLETGERAGEAHEPRRPGRLKGLIDFDDRFFEPFPEPELARWDH